MRDDGGSLILIIGIDVLAVARDARSSRTPLAREHLRGRALAAGRLVLL